MKIEEINSFVDEEIKKIESYYGKKDKQELTMAMRLKVGEELGELFQEILANKGYQRKDKLEKMKREDIEKEFADVIFTVLILAKRFDVDIEKAINIKMNELRNRSYK